MPFDAANGTKLPTPPTSGAGSVQQAPAINPEVVVSSPAFWADMHQRLEILESIVLRKAF